MTPYWLLIAVLQSTIPLAEPLALRLYRAAMDLQREERDRETLSGDLAMGTVTRLKKDLLLGSIGGPGFEAEIDTPSGSGRVRFILTREGIERDQPPSSMAELTIATSDPRAREYHRLMRSRGRVWILAALFCGGGAAMAGMGLSSRQWTELSREAVFLATATDWRGAKASFFVDAADGRVLGPFDHQRPPPPHYGAPAPVAAPAPKVAVGARGQLRFLGATVIPERTARKETPPIDGSFVSFAPSGSLTPAQVLARVTDPFALGLLGAGPTAEASRQRIRALGDEGALHQAMLGLLLVGAKDAARALLRERLAGEPADPRRDLRPVVALLLDGLPGLARAIPCRAGPGRCHSLYAVVPAAQAWLAGDREAAQKRLRESGLGTTVYFQVSDERAPLEHAPQEPIVGPFVRDDYCAAEYGDILKQASREFHAQVVSVLTAAQAR